MVAQLLEQGETVSSLRALSLCDTCPSGEAEHLIRTSHSAYLICPACYGYLLLGLAIVRRRPTLVKPGPKRAS